MFRPLAAYAQTVTIAGNHPPSAATLTSPAAAGLALTIRISFALRNVTELHRLLTDQQNPSSPHYHRWITPAEFDHRFGRTPAEVRTVSDWLKGQGFQVADQSLRRITATSTAAVAEAAFQTTITTSPDNLTFANVTDPEIPVGLASVIGSIEGLSNTSKAVPLIRKAPRSFTVSALVPGLDAAVAVDGLPLFGSIPVYSNGTGVGFGPQDFYTFYDETSLLNSGTDGSGGDCIALPETSDYPDSAIAMFDSTFALPEANITRVFPDGNDPGISPEDVETLADIEWTHTVAPGAPLRVYVGAEASPLQDAIQRAVTDNACGAISISYAYCDINPSFFTGTLDPMFAQASAQGQSVFVASGDTGAAGIAEPAGEIGCGTGTSQNVSEMAADPNVTGVGGTEFVPNYDGSGNDIGFVPESVWDESSGASGGGASKIFGKPAYQTASTPADGARDVPDVAYAASPDDPGYYLGFVNNSGSAALACCLGGTSVAAPIWAGVIKLISESNGRVGNINPRLYQLGPLGDTVGIRDVTSGNNSFNGVTGFDAVPGYDQATGWGSADITTFVNSWNIVISTPTPTTSPSPSPTPASTPTASPSPSPTPAPTPTAVPSSSPTPAPTPTAVPSSSPTLAPAPTPAPKPLAPTISPTSINFGAERENTTSASHTLTVTNPGISPASLIISGSTISSQFSIYGPSTTCTNGKSLAAGSSCVFALRFTPTAVGNIAGILSIADNASNSPQAASLSGFGQN